MLESLSDNKFTYQKLTEEEQKKRRILGRLTGIIADSKNATRNGRLYSIDLWKKVFDDPIMEEKIKNRCCFGECGHPANREEVDMEKIAICLAEKPKVGKDGNLYGIFDILDTPCGKILKTLCDYGCNIGISSRGTGDLYTNENGQEAVDPDTYNCECFDAVLLPAVKSARLQMVNESLNTKTSLKKALVEDYKNASDEDKAKMKETLESLNIKLDEAASEAPVDIDGIPEMPSIAEDVEDDVEIVDEEPAEEVAPEEEAPAEEPQPIETTVEEVKDIALDAAKAALAEEEAAEVILPEEDVKEITDGVVEDKLEAPAEEEPEEAEIEEPVEAEEPVEEQLHEDAEEEAAEPVEEAPTALTVGAFIDELKDYDNDLSLEWKPIVIDDKEYPIEAIAFDNSEDGKIIASVSYTLPSEENAIEELPADENPEVEAEINSDEEPAEEPKENAEEAGDAGDEEVFESLKEAIRSKDALNAEVKELKNQKAVSDTEVARLKEELEKYKLAFKRTSELAAKTSKFEKENKALTEQLNQKDTEIQDLKTKVENTSRLTESVSTSNAKIKELTERLEATVKEAADNDKALKEEVAEYRAKVKSRTEIAKSYKAKYDAVVEGYITMKANMLGVRPTDITSRLAESYTLDDINTVCNDLLNQGRPTFGLNYGKASMKINESVNSVKKPDPDNGYEIDDSLLELAGLK